MNFLDPKGNSVLLHSIEAEEKTLTVYNFTVDDFHTYFVSKSDVLVHNCDNEVRKTLDRIRRQRPKYRGKDGTVFRNREGKLPRDGNYREWTVDTPGLNHRGKRRVVVDQNTGDMYYTNDHYVTFIKME